MNEVLDQARIAMHTVWNRRWLALGIAWGVCLLGWLVVATIPNSYQSSARISVQLDDVLSEQIGISGNTGRDIQRVRQSLTSAVNLEKVIRSTRLGQEIATQREMEMAITKLAENITVVNREESLFELTATIGRSELSDAENAALAQDVVQKLIELFRENNYAGNRGEVAETIAFLDQQLAARATELEAAELQRTAFEAQHPELIGGANAISSRLQSSRSEMRGIDADLAAAQSALAAINGQLAGTPRTLVTPGAIGGARAALIQAQSQLAGLQARGLTDQHPDVVAQKRQVALLERQAANEGSGATGSPNPAYSSLTSIQAERSANVQALLARKAALQAEISNIVADQVSEPGLAAEANRISRDYEVLKTKYDELLKDREEMRLRGQVESARSSFKFDVIDPPSTPRVPAAPNRPLLLLSVLIAGIGAGVGTVLLLGQLRSTFATAGGLERAMDLPVIGTISTSLTDAARAARAKRLKMFMAGSAALVGMFVVLLAAEFVQRGMVA